MVVVDRGLLYVCITHVALPLPFPPFVTPLQTDAAQGEGKLNLRDLSPDWERRHPLLGGAAGTFAVLDLLARTPGVERIGLCQYRKFVSRSRLSRRVAQSYRAMDVVTAADLPAQRFAVAMHPGDAEFLLPRPLLFKHAGILGQYAEMHRVQDLLHFTAEAVDLGVLAPREARAFLGERTLVPGGLEMGVYPVPFWRDNAGALAAVVARCIDRHPVPDAGYQKRAWAFCAERLGSWLLVRYFRGNFGARRSERVRERLAAGFSADHWTRRHVGHLNLIDVDGRADYVAGGT